MATAAHPVEEIPSRASPIVSIDRGGVEIVDRWADEWRRLCEEAVDDQPFYHPEWIAAHIRAFTPKAKVLLLTVMIDSKLSAVLPLLEERALFCGVPVRRLRAPVNGHSCRFDAVRSRGSDGDVSVQALWEALRRLRWDMLEFEGIPSDGTLAALAEIAKRSGFRTGHIPISPNPYIPLPEQAAKLPELPPNKKLRSQLGSIRRKLANHGELKLRRICKADQTILKRFYELESAGWKGREKTAIAASCQCISFYDEIARSEEKVGRLSIYLLELNDQLVAAHFGLSHKGRYFSPKVAYDENSGEWAPGHLIVQEILRDCVERGIHEYDITGQNDLWKRKWTDRTRGQCTQYIFGATISGNWAHLARFHVRPWLKRLVHPVLRKLARSN